MVAGAVDVRVEYRHAGDADLDVSEVPESAPGQPCVPDVSLVLELRAVSGEVLPGQRVSLTMLIMNTLGAIFWGCTGLARARPKGPPAVKRTTSAGSISNRRIFGVLSGVACVVEDAVCARNPRGFYVRGPGWCGADMSTPTRLETLWQTVVSQLHSSGQWLSGRLQSVTAPRLIHISLFLYGAMVE